ncbi:MAG: hypothetical protein ACREQV_03470 [Candidatus Binatia bacterium]
MDVAAHGEFRVPRRLENQEDWLERLPLRHRHLPEEGGANDSWTRKQTYTYDSDGNTSKPLFFNGINDGTTNYPADYRTMSSAFNGPRCLTSTNLEAN